MISFVVPAYNEERLLGATLNAIHSSARALGEPYELIVVDDGSTDGTAAVAQALGAQVVQVQHRQIARARNAGAEVAKGDILIFVDADTIVPSSTVRATVEALRKGAVGGGAMVQFEGRLPFYAHLLLPLFHVLMRLGGLAAGCYLFCSRAAFEAVGGFDDRLFGAEEIAMSRALRRCGRVVILSEAVTTSGRKLRAHSGWELVRLFSGLARRGPAGVRSRENLSIWYSDRREDPDIHT